MHTTVTITLASIASSQYILVQEWVISGLRDTCGGSQRFQWSVDAFRENVQITNVPKNVCEVKFVALKWLHRIKCICAKTVDIKPFLWTTIVFVLFICFAIKLEGTPLRWTWLSQIGPQVKIIAHRCMSEWLWRYCCSTVRQVFPKPSANSHLGAMCNSSRGNAEPKPQRCSVLFFLWHKILKVIRHNRYYDLSNGSNKFGNHCAKRWWDNVTGQCSDCDRWLRNNTWTVSNIFSVHLLRK